MKTHQLIQLDRTTKLGDMIVNKDYSGLEFKFPPKARGEYGPVFVRLVNNLKEKNVLVQTTPEGIIVNNCTEDFVAAVKQSLLLHLNILAD